MQDFLVAVLSLHLLAAIFWAGTTFALAFTGGVGDARLFRARMIAALIAFLAGGYLWGMLRPAGGSEVILGLGVICAIAAAGVQGALGGRAIREMRNGTLGEADGRARVAAAERIAAILLAITIICMAAARYI